MNAEKVSGLGLAILLTGVPFALAQSAGPAAVPTPLYRVTVVGRTVKAINYQYRGGPTTIDFRGTVLLPYAKGEATVESHQGRVEIDAKLQGLVAPQRFGREYLTYVLWAITPEGRPHNLGELVADASDRARSRVTTDLQAFALIVTAEPYSAVRQPGDVVVAENEVRPDTLGSIEEVTARFELLPRGMYTLQVPKDASSGTGPKLSLHEYEAVTELYEAQYAVGAAKNAGADQYAPETLARAAQLLADAGQLRDRHGDFRRIVQTAREAAQTAEDARVISGQRRETERLNAANAELSKTQAELSNAHEAQQRAVSETRQAQLRAMAALAQAQAATASRDQAEFEAAVARERTVQTQTAAAGSTAAVSGRQDLEVARKRETRMQLYEEMEKSLPTLDTTRGLVATVSDESFRGAGLRTVYADHLAGMASTLARHPGVHIDLEGYSSTAEGQPLSRERADAVRRALIAGGVSAKSAAAAGLGDTRPLGSNATPQGQKQNSRVEIVVTGESIGDAPFWQPNNSSSDSRRLSPGSIE